MLLLSIKKETNRFYKNQRPVFLLPICGKIFERLISINPFEYFIGKDLISQNQSDFKPGDSCINQLIYIVHEIYQSFDDGREVKDKAWHEDLICKLNQNGVKSNLLDTLTNFLNDRKQRVIINGRHSKWGNIEASDPQGSILGPLLFFDIYKRLTWQLNFESKIVCRWHITFFQ